MSSPATPSPPKSTNAVPANPSMAPPATPSASTIPETVPRTPNGHLPKTPSMAASPVAHTPGGSIKQCATDPAEFSKQTARTAVCPCCEKKNGTDHMLKCPGCNWVICLPCQEKRKKKGEDLKHGSLRPSLSLSGPSKRNRLPPAGSTPLPPTPLRRSTSAAPDITMASPTPEAAPKSKGKAKENALPPTAKPTNKKRATKFKPKSSKLLADDESSSSAFSDPDSPTRKKQRLGVPTATSIRPSRTQASATYIPRSSPGSDSDVASSAGRRLSTMNDAELAQQFHVEVEVRPASRVQELLEQHGVDTPGNRYEQHLLTTHQPVLSSRVVRVPGVVARMSDSTPRLSAEQKVDARNEAAINATNATPTVRTIAANFALTFQSPSYTPSENNELFNAVKEKASGWSARTYKQLPAALQATVAKGLEMRLDHIDAVWRLKLKDVLEKVARRKVGEFEERKGDGEGEEGALV